MGMVMEKHDKNIASYLKADRDGTWYQVHY